MHNQLRQDGLQLEKKWITQDGNFRLATGLIGMTVVDVYKLGQYHGMIQKGMVLFVTLLLFHNYLLIHH